MRRILGTVAVAFTLLVVGMVPAHAEAPSPSVSSNVTDRNNKIDDSRLELLVKQVQDETDYELFVYVTDTLNGMSGAQWAVETANKSHLNDSNAVLFVIATTDRKYGSAYPSNSTLSSKISTVEAAAIPFMKNADWNGAVEAYGNKLIEASHGAVAEGVKSSESTDKAVAGFFGVLTFIIGLLVGLALLVATFIFGRRFVTNVVNRRQDVKNTKEQILKFNLTLPGIVSKIDSDLNDVNERISFGSAMHGEKVMAGAVKDAKSASTSLQTAITYMSEAANTKNRDVIRKNLKFADSSLRTAKDLVSRAQNVLDDLKAQQDVVTEKAAELTKISNNLNGSLSSYEAKAAKLKESYDGSFLENLNDALDFLKATASSLTSKVSAISPETDFPKAREAVSDGAFLAEKVTRAQEAFATEVIAINEIDKFRDATIAKSLKTLRGNSNVNHHERIISAYDKAVKAVEGAAGINVSKGNPRKALTEALRPFEAYVSAVTALQEDADHVTHAKKVAASALAQKWGQVDSLVKDAKAYRIPVTGAEQAGLDAAVLTTGAKFKALRAKVEAVEAYDVRGITAVSVEVNDIVDEVSRQVEAVASKVAKAEAEMEAARKREQEAKARAEAERRRKQQEEEEARRKKRRKEEEEASARRRRDSSSSSYSSSYSSSSYSSSSSSSGFSGSGGSFGGDSGSGGSF
jgi:uncharacterized membrane protein YgcG